MTELARICNNQFKDTRTAQTSVKDWNNIFETKKIALPTWQREDNWSLEFKIDLIKSILLNVDIPKFYVTKISDVGDNITYLIDGGHRTRTINEYMNNIFSIPIDDVYYYFNRLPPLSKINAKLLIEQPELYKYFTNYKLTIVQYDSISEVDARFIFNKLQNAVPMTIADVINTYETKLVEFLRDLIVTDKYGIKLINFYTKTYKPLNYVNGTNLNKNKILYDVCSKFTIFIPVKINTDYEDECVQALSSIMKGPTMDSPCLNYIKSYNEEIDDKTKMNFINHLKEMFKYINMLNELNITLLESELNTLLHSMRWLKSFNFNIFINFLRDCNKYNNHIKNANKFIKNKNYKNHSIELNNADILNNKSLGTIQQWIKSKTGGIVSSNKKNMITRLEIICKVNKLYSQIEPEPEPNL